LSNQTYNNSNILSKKDYPFYFIIELYYLRGLAEPGYGSYDSAIEDLTYYLKFFDDDGEAYFRRGLAVIYSGNKEEAKSDFLLAVEYGFIRGNEILNKYY
jgi:tetratricopeptide (TPR) repeat protein